MRRALTVTLLGLPLAGAAYGALTKRLLRMYAARLMDGDIDGFLRFYADDATLEFPGDNSWGPAYRGKDEIRGFLERFLSVGLRGEVHEIAITGPPWAATVFVRFTDRVRAPDGTLVYENDAVIRLESRWGKVVRERVYEDTEKVAELDRYLEANAPAVTVG